MAIKFFNDHAKNIVSDEDIKAIAPKAVEALNTLHNKTGEGNDFLGWVDLPTNYDKEEFDRIKKSAEFIKENADILVVIGIGGSYLGASAAIEFLRILSVIQSALLLSAKLFLSVRVRTSALM